MHKNRIYLVLFKIYNLELNKNVIHNLELSFSFQIPSAFQIDTYMYKNTWRCVVIVMLFYYDKTMMQTLVYRFKYDGWISMLGLSQIGKPYESKSPNNRVMKDRNNRFQNANLRHCLEDKIDLYAAAAAATLNVIMLIYFLCNCLQHGKLQQVWPI